MIKILTVGGIIMKYRIEEKPEIILTGFKKHYAGDLHSVKMQNFQFVKSTRLKQYVLEGLAHDCNTIYNIITNFGDDGYDYYIASKLCETARRNMARDIGLDLAREFEHITVPAGLYLVCETEQSKYPADEVDDLRRSAVFEWFPQSGYELRNAPEIEVIHWFWEEDNEEVNGSRYCELWLPIVKKAK